MQNFFPKDFIPFAVLVRLHVFFLLNAEGGIALIVLKCLKLLSAHPKKLRPLYRTLQPMRNHFLWFAKENFFEVEGKSEAVTS
jgi:hypothetical protein